MFEHWRRGWMRWISEPTAMDRDPRHVHAHCDALIAVLRRHPTAADAVLALLVATITVPQLRYWADQPSGGFALRLVFTAMLVTPIVWRRRSPLGTFAFAAAVALVQWCLNVTVVADLALLIYLYTVASRYRPRVALLAALIVELGLVLATIRWSFAGALGQPLPLTLLLLSGPVLTAVLLGLSVRLRRQSHAASRARAAALQRDRDQQAAMAVAAEAARIAREMHDVVAHSLSVMVTLSDAAIVKYAREPERALATMKQVSATGHESLAQMRGLLGVLRASGGPGALAPQPGLGDLPVLLDQIRAVGIVSTLTITGDAHVAPPGLQLTIYRIVQEATTNTLKHASGATRIDVVLAVQPDSARLTVHDDGRDQVPHTEPAGHGLIGMRERAAIYGGTVSSGPDPTGGWRVYVDLNLTTQSPAPGPTTFAASQRT